MIINSEQVKLIGRGQYSKVYRSIENPNTVYILSPESDHVKEILTHIDSPHVPYMRTLEDHYSRGTWYNCYQTEYTETPKKEHGGAYILAKQLNSIRDKVVNKHLCDGTFRSLRKDERLFEISAEIIESIKADDSIPESIKDALDLIESWMTAYGANCMLEFQLRNLGVKNDGTLVLRDIVFFLPRY